jgi:hypothetical protein
MAQTYSIEFKEEACKRVQSGIPAAQVARGRGTQPVGDNAKLEDIAKMSIDIQLLDLRISGSMGGHRAVSSFIRIIILIEVVSFCIGFELFDNTVGIFRIVFGNESLNSGRVKDSHICFGRINGLTDGLS